MVRSSASSKARRSFNTRYATLGFSEKANLDAGHMWPTAYALTALTDDDEAKIAALVKKAVSCGRAGHPVAKTCEATGGAPKPQWRKWPAPES